MQQDSCDPAEHFNPGPQAAHGGMLTTPGDLFCTPHFVMPEFWNGVNAIAVFLTIFHLF